MNGPSDDSPFELEHYRGYLQVLAEGRLDPRMRGVVDVDALVDEVLRAAFQSSETPDTNPLECLARLRKLLASNMVSEAKRLGLVNQTERSARRSVETALRASTGRLWRLIAEPNQSEPDSLEDPRALLSLTNAIMLLPGAKRRAIEMRFLQNLSVAEISQQLDCPSDKVQTMLEESQLFLKSREA